MERAGGIVVSRGFAGRQAFGGDGLREVHLGSVNMLSKASRQQRGQKAEDACDAKGEEDMYHRRR